MRNQNNETKNCPFCGDHRTKKNGHKLNKQQYQCLNCKRQFLGGKRLNNEQLWQEYTQGKQTYAQLATKYQCSIKTIQRHLDKVIIHQDRQLPNIVNVIMDTTYFGRQFGLMLFIDNTSKAVLHYIIVHYETNLAYQQGTLHIFNRKVLK